MPPILSVSVDLDEVASYHAIHGIKESDQAASRAVWTKAVPRFVDLFDRLSLRATFFVVGESLDPDVGGSLAKDLTVAGHEIANHTFSHYYDLLRRGPSQRRDEIVRAAEVIESATGSPPRGFRAPGYNVDDELLQIIAELGYVYDSSVFPCPPYYLAKAAALVAIRARGRESRSILGPKEALLAPTEPYVLDAARPFWRKRRLLWPRSPRPKGLIELPIAVMPGVRTPFIGTTLSLAGPRAASFMARTMMGRRFIGLELHGVDLLDLDDEGLGDLEQHQPDIKIPLDRKLETLEAVITTLTNKGAQPMTCLEAAKALRKRLG